MMNVYDDIRASLHFNKFEVGDLVFVEYTCPIEEDSLALWTSSDYLIYVLSGRKTWRTPHGSWTATKGQTFFVKKGAYTIDQFFDEEFCMLLFFISDEFVSSTVRGLSIKRPVAPDQGQDGQLVMKVDTDMAMLAYFQSMLVYFSKRETPSADLLTLKLKELLIGVLQSPGNKELSSYLVSLADNQKPSLRQVMEANFCYNLPLMDFARLCKRSLSSFKRDFKETYGLTPGKWLLRKRLEYAAALLAKPKWNISQICYECGFEDLSHFSRVFKQTFRVSPTQYRKNLS